MTKEDFYVKFVNIKPCSDHDANETIITTVVTLDEEEWEDNDEDEDDKDLMSNVYKTYDSTFDLDNIQDINLQILLESTEIER